MCITRYTTRVSRLKNCIAYFGARPAVAHKDVNSHVFGYIIVMRTLFGPIRQLHLAAPGLDTAAVVRGSKKGKSYKDFHALA